MDPEVCTNINTKFDTVLLKLESIERKLSLIQQDVSDLKLQLDRVETSAAHMDSHITKIDNVYAQVHDPFHAVMNAAGKYFGSGAVTHEI